MSTDQEKFWEGEFGDSYISRNQSDGRLAHTCARLLRLRRVVRRQRRACDDLHQGSYCTLRRDDAAPVRGAAAVIQEKARVAQQVWIL